MFDTMKIAKKIKDARIGKNMTQMDLADAMGVSYQAVSNWERGNSMPDISKLEDLCGALGLEVSELLGIENKGTTAVVKVMQQEDVPLTPEELADIAPMLPPAEVKDQAKKQKLNVAALVDIAPYLDDELLEELVEDLEVESLLVLTSLAPYLDEDALDKLVRKAPKDDFDGIAAMAPYLSEETLDYLVDRCEATPEDKAFLEELACFLSEETLDKMVQKWGNDLSVEMMESLAPYLSEDALDALADIQVAKGNAGGLTELYPYMEGDTIRKIAKALMKEGNMGALKEAAHYL